MTDCLVPDPYFIFEALLWVQLK